MYLGYVFSVLFRLTFFVGLSMGFALIWAWVDGGRDFMAIALAMGVTIVVSIVGALIFLSAAG